MDIVNSEYGFLAAYHPESLLWKGLVDPFPASTGDWNVGFLIEPPRDWEPRFTCPKRSVPPFHIGADNLYPTVP